MRKEEKTIIVEIFGTSPKVRIISFLLDFPFNDFTKEEMVRNLGMSKTTFYNNFGILEKYKIVLSSRKIGRATLYKINLEHPLVKRIKEMEREISIGLIKEKQLVMPT